MQGRVQRAVVGDERPQRFSRVPADAPVGLGADALGEGRSLDLGGDEVVRGAEPSGADVRAHSVRPQTCLLDEAAQLTEVTAGPVGVQQARTVLPGVFAHDVDEQPVRGLVLDGGGHDQPDAAAVAGHPCHLGHGTGTVREEHQRHLAQHDVERLAGERQRERVRAMPLELRPHPAGHGQHRLIEIHSDDALGSDVVRGDACHDPGAAGHVENGLTGADARHADQQRRRLADLRVRQGRFAEAGRLLSGFEFDSYAVRPLARLHLACGEPELAVVALRRFLGSAGTAPLQAPELALLVEAEIATGNIDGARMSCDQLLRVADVNYTQALAHHAAGLVCVATGDERALEQFERALPLFTLAGLRLEAARTRMAIARLLASTNSVVANAEARSALSTFDELSAAHDAQEAARFLRTLGDHRRAAPRAPGSLSKREEEVLRELCEGRTNEQIAERLFISKRTVEHHVSSILEKLGASSRAEAAAHALRHPAE